MKLLVLFVITLVWSNANSACVTPLGRNSECISFYSCPSFVEAFKQRPLPSNVVEFLRSSQCGFEDNTGLPLVCCGPLPANSADQPATRPPSSNKPRPVSSGVDPVNPEDSYPSPKNVCGIDTNGDRIYGGQITDIDEYPWMALLGYEPNDKGPTTYQCGGVLINPRYVLSAAHCVVGEIETAVGRLVSVRLGEYDIQQDPDCIKSKCADPVQEIAVHSTYPHPGFSDKNRNRRDDISLVRMAKRAKLTFYVQPICVASRNTPLDAGSEVFVAGWGKTRGGESSPIKLKLKLPIFSKSQCVTKYRSLNADITDKQICAGGAFAKDACRGDSGGPLMRNYPVGTWETVAVVSFGYGCGREGWPGVYTSIAAYRDWIDDTLRSSNV